jgi:Protein of unknown function (DUF2726)
MESLAWLTVVGPALAGAALVVQIESPRRSFSRANSLPYSKKKFFFSTAQRSLYDILRYLTPDHSVFANVRLCDLVSVSNESKNWQMSRNQKNLDFLICDATLAPVIAIELHPSRARTARKSRDQFVDTALAAAAIPIVRMPAKRSYVLEEVRRLIFPHVRGLGPVC